MMKARHFYRLLMSALMLVGISTNVRAQEYITEIMTIGAENSNDAKKVRDEYTKKGWTVLNNDLNPKAIGEATKFYSLDASKGVYEGSVKLSWHVDQQGSVYTKTYIVERRRAE